MKLKTLPKHIEAIFNINSDEEFNAKALEIFHFQAENCDVYRTYLSLLGIRPKLINKLEEIPFLPVELFKTKKIFMGDDTPDLVFKSSGTTETGRSRHFVRYPIIYETAFTKGFEHFYGEAENQVILGLLPSYLEQGESSLVYMTDQLIKQSGSLMSGFYLENFKDLNDVLAVCKLANIPTTLLGVTYALLDFAEEFPQDLSGIRIMETGGMKGRRKEMIRSEVHSELKDAFNVNQIHSEYGMTELLSQAYSKGDGIFKCPRWMQISLRKNTDPVYSDPNLSAGMVNIIDLANIESCSFIATQDLGKIGPDGFEILGRTDHSDVRGCSQLTL